MPDEQQKLFLNNKLHLLLIQYPNCVSDSIRFSYLAQIKSIEFVFYEEKIPGEYEHKSITKFSRNAHQLRNTKFEDGGTTEVESKTTVESNILFILQLLPTYLQTIKATGEELKEKSSKSPIILGQEEQYNFFLTTMLRTKNKIDNHIKSKEPSPFISKLTELLSDKETTGRHITKVLQEIILGYLPCGVETDKPNFTYTLQLRNRTEQQEASPSPIHARTPRVQKHCTIM